MGISEHEKSDSGGLKKFYAETLLGWAVQYPATISTPSNYQTNSDRCGPLFDYLILRRNYSQRLY